MKKILICLFFISKFCTGQHHSVGALNIPSATWAQTCSTYPSPLTVYPINRFIQAEVTDGNFSLFRRFWVFGLDATTSAIISLSNPSATAITMVNSPSFSPYHGFTFDGATTYLNTGYNASTDGSYKLDSNSLGMWYNTVQSVGNYGMGTYDGTTANLLYMPRYNATVFSGYSTYNNNLAASSEARTTTAPFLAVTGNLNSTTVFFMNNGSITSTPAAAVAIPNVTYYIGAYHGPSGAAGFIDSQISMAFIGNNINEATFNTAVTQLSTELQW